MYARRYWSRTSRNCFVIAALVVSVLIVGTCAFLRIRHPRGILAYVGMAREAPPVWRQFALRRFEQGDSASELLKQFPPDSTEEFGRYGLYSYTQSPTDGIPFTGLWVRTRDGKLLSAEASGCTWQFTFFHTDVAGFDKARRDRDQGAGQPQINSRRK